VEVSPVTVNGVHLVDAANLKKNSAPADRSLVGLDV